MNTLKVRKHAAELSFEEATEYVGAVKALKASGKYDEFVLTHAKAPMHMIHRGPAFLPWHRQFLLEFEKELQDISGNPNLMVPYWDWGVNAAYDYPEEYSMWDDHFMGGNGHPDMGHAVNSGPFRSEEWTIIDMMGNPAGPLIRNFGEKPFASSLPSKESTEALIENPIFDQAPWNHNSMGGFRNILEGWIGGDGPQFHNRCHVWVSGSMTPMTSPNDPVFFLLHAYVDKLWADWQLKHPDLEAYLPNGGAMMGHNLQDDMEPTHTGIYNPVDLLDIEALGYIYDDQVKEEIPDENEGTDPEYPDNPDQNPPEDTVVIIDPPIEIDPPEDTDPPIDADPPTNPKPPSNNKGCMMTFFFLFMIIFIACRNI